MNGGNSPSGQGYTGFIMEPSLLHSIYNKSEMVKKDIRTGY